MAESKLKSLVDDGLITFSEIENYISLSQKTLEAKNQMMASLKMFYNTHNRFSDIVCDLTDAIHHDSTFQLDVLTTLDHHVNFSKKKMQRDVSTAKMRARVKARQSIKKMQAIEPGVSENNSEDVSDHCNELEIFNELFYDMFDPIILDLMRGLSFSGEEETRKKLSHHISLAQKLIWTMESTTSPADITPEELLGDFRALLANPYGIQYFKWFAEKEHCEENLLFWELAAEFRSSDYSRVRHDEDFLLYCRQQMASPTFPFFHTIKNSLSNGCRDSDDTTLMIVCACYIYDRFVKTGSEREINISSPARKNIEAIFHSTSFSDLITPDMFHNAQENIFTDLIQNVYPRFLDSSFSKRLLYRLKGSCNKTSLSTLYNEEM